MAEFTPTRIIVESVKRGEGQVLDLLPEDTLLSLIAKIRRLDNIDDNLGINLYFNGEPLSEGKLKAFASNDKIRYALSDPEITELFKSEAVSYERQKDLYVDLARLYEKWKVDPKSLEPKERLVPLPQLSATPKNFVDDKFVVRDCVLALFKNYEKWSEEVNYAHYGYFIAGQEGIGKSVALYFIVCLARAMNWFVIYIARCDEWINESKNEIDAIKYFARQAAAGIAPFYGHTKTKWRKLITNILESDSLENAQSAFHTFIRSLKAYDAADYPILLVFDEANALKGTDALFAPGSRAATIYPFNIAASLDIFSFKRGYKLISGTGNEAFAQSFSSSRGVGTIEQLEPYSENSHS